MSSCIKTTCQACYVSWTRKKRTNHDITYGDVVEQRRKYGECSPKQQCGDVHELVGNGSCRCGKVVPESISTSSVDDIINAVCKVHHITRSDLTGPSRKQGPAEARHDACYLLRQHTRLGLQSIAALVGRKDHTTVIHSIEASKRLRERFPVCLDRMNRILMIL